MAINFPNSPTDGFIYTDPDSGATFKYNSTYNVWNKFGAGDGSQGAQGIQGIQGVQGRQGANGLQGIQGANGLQGITGSGIQGANGTQGIQGANGIQGIQGIQGTNGIQGIQGIQSIQGIQGANGIQGLQGTSGGGGGVGGANLISDTVSATRYITFANNTTGVFSQANVDTDLTYNPSTNRLDILSGGTVNAGSFLIGGSFTAGYLEMPQNIKSNTNYTLVLADSGKHLYSNGTLSNTWTIPANSSVFFPVGTTVSFFNVGTGTITIAITTDTMYLMGTGSTGSRTLAPWGSATATKTRNTEWIISGVNLT